MVANPAMLIFCAAAAYSTRRLFPTWGSLLVALKMDVNWLAKRLDDRPQLHCKCQGMGRLIDTAVDNVGRIITDLRPSILDHQGLWAALEWQAQEFIETTELRADLQMHVAAQTEPPSGPDGDRWSIAVFRIFQEILSNVARIALTGILYNEAGKELGDKVFHDFAGWMMMPLALGVLQILALVVIMLVCIAFLLHARSELVAVFVVPPDGALRELRCQARFHARFAQPVGFLKEESIEFVVEHELDQIGGAKLSAFPRRAARAGEGDGERQTKERRDDTSAAPPRRPGRWPPA